MWQKILEIFAGKAIDRLMEKRTPRKKLAEAFVDLLTSMNSCHEAYLSSYGGPGSTSEEWWQAIVVLGASVDKLTAVLEIHEPELLEALKDYSVRETLDFAYSSHQSKDEYRRELTQRVPNNLMIADIISRDLYEKGGVDYDEAIAQLKKVMREKLKLTPEEIVDV
jgi:hypothetical protein